MPPKKKTAAGTAKTTTRSASKKRARSPTPPADQDGTKMAAAENKGEKLAAGSVAKRPRTEGQSAEASTPSAAVAASEKAAVTQKVTPLTSIHGKFDLYAMKLSFLNEVYCPAGSTDVYPEELYKKILTYQAKKDNTAQIVLPEVRVENGTFHTPIFKDPMEEMPFDIIITDLVVSSKGGPAAFGEYDRPKDDWKGPCLKGKLQIENGGCGIKTSSGKIEIRPLWKKEGAEVMELFEGSFTFDVKYSAMYSKRGHGKGQNLTLNFWAVRAQT